MKLITPPPFTADRFFKCMPRFTLVGSCSVALLLGLSLSARAADKVWSNEGTSDFNLGTNWIGGLPAINDTAIFRGPAVVNPNLSSSFTLSKFSFDTDPAGTGYTISGNPSASLTLSRAGAGGSNSAIEARNASGTNTIAVNLILSQAAEGSAAFNQGGTGALVMSGNISSTNAIAGLYLSGGGGGSITLAGNNSYAGNTSLGGNTTLNINHASALSSGTLTVSASTLGNTSGAAVVLANNNNLIVNGNLTFASVAGTGDLSFGAGQATLAGNRVIAVTNAGSTFAIGSVNSDATTYNLTVGVNDTSAGKLAIASAAGSNFQGMTTVNSGILEIGNKGALGTGNLRFGGSATSTMTFQASASLTGGNAIANNVDLGTTGNALGTVIVGGAHDIEFSGLLTNNSNSRTLTVNNTASTTFSGNVYLAEGGAGRTLTINGSGDAVISGVIANNAANSNTGNLVYAGTGSLLLAGENIYTGTTTVSAGTLLIEGRTAGGAVNVGSAGLLAGAGTIGGATTISGTLGTNMLTFSGNLAMNSGSTYRLEGESLAAVGGTLNLSQPWTLSLAGSQFVDGGSTVIFTFGTLAAAPDFLPTFDLSGLDIVPTGPLSLSQVGNSIVLNGLTVVPEPTAMGLLVGSMTVVMVFARRRRNG